MVVWGIYIVNYAATYYFEYLYKFINNWKIKYSSNPSIQEIFEAIPKLKDNPLVQRVVEVFDEDQSGGVDFKEFVLGELGYIID